MSIALVDPVETALRVAKQTSGKRAGSPPEAGLPAKHTSSDTVFKKRKTIATLNSSIGSASCRECVTDLRSGRMLHPIQPRSTTGSIDTRCISGGRCCAFRRSNTAVWSRRTRLYFFRAIQRLPALLSAENTDSTNGQSNDIDQYRIAGGAGRSLLYQA